MTDDTTTRFKLIWRHRGERGEITETYEERTADPKQWCRDTLKRFNDTRKPGEQARLFVRCEVLGEVSPAKHRWTKKSAMTQQVRGGPRDGQLYDDMICERCGITGKRYGLSSAITIDSKYRARVFKRCNTALEAMKDGQHRIRN